MYCTIHFCYKKIHIILSFILIVYKPLILEFHPCVGLLAEYSLSAEYSAVLKLPNIRFRPKQENPFSLDH